MANPFVKNGRGYDGITLVSALHKSIRRSDARAALYWAFELVDGGWTPLLVSRLRVILFEDHGVTDAIHFLTAKASLDSFRELVDSRKTGWRLALAGTVLAMCAGNKARDCDSLVAVVQKERLSSPAREFPAHILDHHTAAGREVGRTLAACEEESYRIEPHDYSDPALATEGRMAFAWAEASGLSLDDKPTMLRGNRPEKPLPEADLE